MDSKIPIIVPYFGKLPNWYKAWWISALENPMLEFWFFTDSDEIKSEKNIIVHNLSFSDFVNKIQSHFDFDIVCPQPYKLCDYKPAYGEVFKEELKGYDYWGYSDIDLIFGDLKKFFTKELLEEYDKIFIDGHISIFKNNERMNSVYKSQGEYPEYNYKESFTTTDTCYFDEYRGMELKLIREKCKVYGTRRYYMNPRPNEPVFIAMNRKQAVGIWENGVLNQIDSSGTWFELAYIHICKRKMEFISGDGDNVNKMSIVPGMILCNDDTEISKLFEYSSGGKLYKYIWTINRLKAQLKRYSIFKIIGLNKRRKQIAELKERMTAQA